MRKQTWGSHVPLNNAILDTFDINGVIELGAGLFSTPQLFKNTAKAISVEQDQKWIDTIRNDIKEDANHKIIEAIPPSNIIRSTNRSEIPQQVFDEFNGVLNTHITDEYNMMFVDCYSGFRYEALVKHHTKFDIVTFHDYHPRGVKKHYMGGFIPNDKYQMFIDQTYDCHTGFIIKKDLLDRYNDLVVNHQKRVKEWLPATTKIIKL